MKKTFALQLPPAFEAACLLYGLEPANVLQHFADSVLLHGRLYRPTLAVRWATHFFEHYQLHHGKIPVPHTPRQRKYIQTMHTRQLAVLRRVDRLSPEEQEQALKKFYEKWMKGWEEMS